MYFRQLDETLRNRQDDGESILSKPRPLHLVNGGNSFSTPARYGEVSPTTEEPKISSSPIKSPSDVFRESKLPFIYKITKNVCENFNHV